MGAISLYRGNMHRVPGVRRRWLMPSRKITLQEFKSLVHRRSKALSRLRSSTVSANPISKDKCTAIVESHLNVENGLEVGQCSGSLKSAPGERLEVAEKDEKLLVVKIEKPDSSINPNTEIIVADPLSDKEKRKKEVEEKLEVLNQKKHNLVQVLKQILNVEEELKRRNSMVVRPNVPLQVDATNDTGSVSREATLRMGLEANSGGDVEGGENGDVSNQNSHSRHMLRMSSASPLSESLLRKPQYIQNNLVPSRTSMGTSSPSRFGPTGHQGSAANLLTVSVSGASYIASSPSPAASGGTSAFRDTRQPSPWN